MSHTSKQLSFEDFTDILDFAHKEIFALQTVTYIDNKQVDTNDIAKLAIVKATLAVLSKKGIIHPDIDFNMVRPSSYHSNEDNG